MAASRSACMRVAVATAAGEGSGDTDGTRGEMQLSLSVHNVKFVPFSLEAGGVWGPAAKKFFKQCASQADNQDRDVDLYHWSSAKFESTWRDTISVLVARGRAQVGVHSAKSDWSRRILDFAYMDYDDQAAHHE